jgi:hypothetical protein
MTRISGRSSCFYADPSGSISHIVKVTTIRRRIIRQMLLYKLETLAEPVDTEERLFLVLFDEITPTVPIETSLT